jgi:hypothetical protein
MVSLVLMERADGAPLVSPPPAPARAAVARRRSRRPTLRPGVVVAWVALILLIPFLARGLGTPDVDAAPNKTITRSVGASWDDARSPEEGGLIGDEAVAYLGAGDGTYPTIAGYRFTNLNIPPGAIIDAVQFSLVKVDNVAAPLRLDLAFEASDDAAGFGVATPPGSRICTGTTLAFSADQAYLDGQRYTIGDPALLAASLQEVIDRPGWRAGNGVVLIAYGPADPAWSRLAFATADAGPDRAPSLTVTYRLPNGGASAR